MQLVLEEKLNIRSDSLSHFTGPPFLSIAAALPEAQTQRPVGLELSRGRGQGKGGHSGRGGQGR